MAPAVRARSRSRVTRAVRALATGGTAEAESGSQRRASLSGEGGKWRAPSTEWKDSGALGACVHFLPPSRSIRRLVALRRASACVRLRLRMRCESDAGRNAMRAPDGQCDGLPRRGRDKRRLRLLPARAWPAAPAPLRTTTCSTGRARSLLPPTLYLPVLPPSPPIALSAAEAREF